MISQTLLLRKLHRKTYHRRSHFAFHNAFRVFSLVSIVGFITVAVAFFFFQQRIVNAYDKYFSQPAAMLAYKTNAITFLDRNNKVIYRTPGRYATEIVPLEKMSKSLINSTLAAEDKGFYEHDGFSIMSTLRALINDVKKGDLYHQGGSTITQQLARTFFLDQDKSLTRKAREMVLAFEIERRYTKKDILELYLNSVYYGAGAYGAPAAAEVYFDKNVKDLTLAESSLLAGLTTAPTSLSPIIGDKKQAYARQDYVLDMLKKNNLASERQIAKARDEKLKFNKSLPSTANATHFVLYLEEELKKELPEIDLRSSGLTIYTTLDMKLQKKAESLVAEKVKALAHRNVTNGAFYATNPKTGEILTMVGSVDFNRKGWGTVNILTSHRSPGSAIKPIIYASALESRKITAATILEDKPVKYKNDIETYAPTNSDGKFHGSVLPRIALANSLNIPAVKVLEKTGLGTSLNEAKRLGISNLGDKNSYGLSFALGGMELKGMDLATAYSVLANGGNLIKPWGIKKVVDRYGETIFESEPKKQKVLDPRVSYIVSNMLSDNKAREMLFGPGNPLEIGRTAAAKTGTAQDFKNTWTVGYTPSLLALSWFGNNNGSSMDNIWGLESAALVWNNFMRFALAGTPEEKFAKPSGIVTTQICKIDGSLASAGQPAVKEVFLKGTEPKNYGACSFLAQKEKDKEIRKPDSKREEPDRRKRFIDFPDRGPFREENSGGPNEENPPEEPESPDEED